MKDQSTMLRVALADDVATKWVAKHARACKAGDPLEANHPTPSREARAQHI